MTSTQGRGRGGGVVHFGGAQAVFKLPQVVAVAGDLSLVHRMQLIYIITHTAPISTEETGRQGDNNNAMLIIIFGLQNAIDENKSFERQRTCRPYFKKQRQQIVIIMLIMMIVVSLLVNDL